MKSPPKIYVAIAAGKKAFQDNEFNNAAITLKIAKLRYERANLLGYETHSHFVLEERMAQNPDKVKSFMNDLLEKAKPAAQREFAQLTTFATQLDGIMQLEKWDGPYYSEKLKQQLFNLDDELLKPYFKLENVLNGAFTVAEKLFGITFKEVFDIDKYHEEVQTFEVFYFEGKLVAIFYTDFFPRKGKRNGAWMTSYKPQFIKRAIHEKELKRCKVYPSDVIINIVGPPLGKVALIPDTFPEWNMNQAIVLFRPKEILLPVFLYYVLGFFLIVV